jgi:hypothetical protein
MIKVFFKGVLGFLVGFLVVTILGSVLAFLETLTGIPFAKAYLGSGLCYPIGLGAYVFCIYKAVTMK